MLDPIQIGQRLREIRKKKKIRLEDLTDIFSIGKLSNIEKGKIFVSVDDVQKICERLKVPIEDVIDDSTINESNRVISDLKRIRYLLSLGNLKNSRELMKITKSKINELEINYLVSEIDFYYGAYMLKRNNLRFARVFFKKVVEKKADYEHARQFKIRAYNALTYIEFTFGKISLAWHCTNLAKELISTSPSKLIDDEAIVYFNSSIIALHLGDFYLAFRNAQTALAASDGSFQQLIRFVIATIQFLNEEFGPAKINLDMCIESFSREEDPINLSRASLVQYYMYKKFPKQYKNEVAIVEDYLFDGMVTSMNSNDNINKRYLYVLHTFLQVAIDYKEHDFAKKILNRLFQCQEKAPQLLWHYKTYYLAAKLIRETTKDTQLEKELLEKSLSFIDSAEFIEKAIILHDIYSLNGVKEGILYESNTIFYNLSQLNMGSFNVIKNLMPDLRY